MGIPPEIIAHARENLVGGDSSVEMMEELETARRQALNDRGEAERARSDAEILRSRAETELAKFEKTRREIREQVLPRRGLLSGMRRKRRARSYAKSVNKKSLRKPKLLVD